MLGCLGDRRLFWDLNPETFMMAMPKVVAGGAVGKDQSPLHRALDRICVLLLQCWGRNTKEAKKHERLLPGEGGLGPLSLVMFNTPRADIA